MADSRIRNGRPKLEDNTGCPGFKEEGSRNLTTALTVACPRPVLRRLLRFYAGAEGEHRPLCGVSPNGGGPGLPTRSVRRLYRPAGAVCRQGPGCGEVSGRPFVKKK